MYYYYFGAVHAMQAHYYKKYLDCCRWLQIDPSMTYELYFIQQEVEACTQQFEQIDDIDTRQLHGITKQLLWFCNHYKRITGQNFLSSYNFCKIAQKDLRKGNLYIGDFEGD